MTVEHNLNGIVIKPPLNQDELNYGINFDVDSTEESLSTLEVEFQEESADILYGVFNGGTSGGLSITEGVPYEINITTDNGIVFNLFQGKVDLTSARFDRALVSATIIQNESLEWLNDAADGVSFDRLYLEGKITDSDFKFLPYVVENPLDAKEIFLATFTIAFVFIELSSAIQQILGISIEGLSLIDTLGAIIRLIPLIVWIILLLITLVKLIIDFVLLYIQPIKFKPSMLVVDLLRIGLAEIGMNFVSPVLQGATLEGLTIIPQSYHNPTDQSNGLKGFLSPNADQKGYYRGTLRDLVLEVKKVFYFRTEVIGSTVYLLPKNQVNNNPTVQLKPYYNRAFTPNASKLVANYNLSWRFDSQDENTINEWQGTNVDVSYSQSTIGVRNNVLLTGGEIVSLGFARAKRKNELTTVEKVFDFLIQPIAPLINSITQTARTVVDVVNRAVNDAIDLINKIPLVNIKKPKLADSSKIKDPNLQDLISQRLGVMKLSSDFITVNKMVIIDYGSNDRANKISDRDSNLDAKTLYNTYHSDRNYQSIFKTFEKVELTVDDVLQIRNDKSVLLNDGRIAQVNQLEYNVSTRLGKLDLEIRQIYSNNIKITINEPSGS